MIRSLTRLFEIARVVSLSALAELRHLFTRYRRGARCEVWEIDVVYLWSDPSDPKWAQRRGEVLAAEERDDFCKINLQPVPPKVSLDEFRFSLRSLDQHLNGVRNIHVVVDKQLPDWLDTEHPRIKIVEVGDLISEPEHYPNYNTQAIESYFHNISGLSERFIYFNDDFFLRRPAGVDSFFTTDGDIRVRLGRALAPKGNPGREEEGDSAGHMNSNRLLDQCFGRRARLTVMHRPYAHRKSLLAYAAERFHEAFEETRSSRFRSPRMFAIHSFLVPYAANRAGRADLVPPRLLEKDMFIWSSDLERNRATMRRVRSCRGVGFCIQEARDSEIDMDSANQFREFMLTLYPERSQFERSDPESTR